MKAFFQSVSGFVSAPAAPGTVGRATLTPVGQLPFSRCGAVSAGGSPLRARKGRLRLRGLRGRAGTIISFPDPFPGTGGTFLLRRKQIRQENQQQENGSHRYGHIGAGRMLNIPGKISQQRDGEYRITQNIFVMHQVSVHVVIGIAFGTEAEDGAVLRIGYHLHDAVGGHGVLVKHESDDIA